MHFNHKNAIRAGNFQPLSVKGILVLCLLIFASSCVQTDVEQYQTTPLLDSLRDKADIVAGNHHHIEAIKFLDSVYKKHRKHNIADKFEYYYFLQDRYRNLEDFNRSELYIDSMFWLIETTGSTERMASQYAKANILRADILFAEADYSKAYEYYYRAKKLAEKSTDVCVLGYYNYRVALVLYASEKYEQAIDNFKEAFTQMNTCSDYISYYYRLQEILDNIGLSYYNLNKPDSALVYYKKAIDYIKQGEASYDHSKEDLFNKALAVVYGNTGSVYMVKGEYKQAEELFNKSILINSQIGYDNIDAQYTRIKLAQIYLNKNDLKEAYAILSTVKKTQDTLPSMNVNLRWQNVMWQYWDKSGDRKNAFDYLLRYNFLKDSINSSKKKALRMDIDERVENLDVAYQMKSLQKKDELTSNYLLIAAVIAILLFIIVLLAVQNWRKSNRNIRVLTSLNRSMNEQKKELEGVLVKLEKADKEKDRILKAVSHDMRSPVNSALALAELLLADTNITSQQKEYVELIKNSCSGALTLTKDLLEIVSLTRENIKKESTEINQLVSEQVELLHFRAAQKNQKIHLHLLPQSEFFLVNPEKIARVINNLVSNAIKFSLENTAIYISLKKIGKGIQISVHDSGIGIPEEMKNKVFDVFTEAKRFGTAGEEPYGLGLSITKQIIEAHNGKIWFESEIGKGTTFYVYLVD